MPIGPVMLDLEGPFLTAQEADILQNPIVGGVILFSRNYQNTQQIQELIYRIRQCRKEPVLIAVDQEGGRVQRFLEGFTPIPPASYFGSLHEENASLAREYAETAGWLIASELFAVGVDLSFAPVLDLNTGISAVIGNRAFHADPQVVTALAGSFISGMHEAGMAATAKHFPGHGSVQADSHLAIPVDPRELDAITATDMLPFNELIYSLDAVMPAHIVFPQMDSLPVGFSRIWLQEILRDYLGFEGAVFSDDLSMKGAEAAGTYIERAQAALAAGCDMILVCNHRSQALDIINSLEGYDNPRSQQRLLKLCGYFQMTWNELTGSETWRAAHKKIRDCVG